LRAQGSGMDQPGFGAVAGGGRRGCFRHVTSIVTTRKWSQKTGLENSTGRDHTVPGLFSDLFNVAASRPAQITTGTGFYSFLLISVNRRVDSGDVWIQVTRPL
jgi:hypothetical protein